jgi:translation initiation factor IF-3
MFKELALRIFLVTIFCFLLPNKATSTTNIGELCEIIAFKKVRHDYPKSTYKIVRNVEYHDLSSAGELDLVVINKNNKRVVKVFEVKCFRNAHKALQKSQKQRQRFLNALRTAKLGKNTLRLKFRHKYEEIEYKQFYLDSPWVTISYDSEKNKQLGFEMFSLRYIELLKLLLKINHQPLSYGTTQS